MGHKVDPFDLMFLMNCSHFMNYAAMCIFPAKFLCVCIFQVNFRLIHIYFLDYLNKDTRLKRRHLTQEEYKGIGKLKLTTLKRIKWV